MRPKGCRGPGQGQSSGQTATARVRAPAHGALQPAARQDARGAVVPYCRALPPLPPPPPPVARRPPPCHATTPPHSPLRYAALTQPAWPIGTAGGHASRTTQSTHVATSRKRAKLCTQRTMWQHRYRQHEARGTTLYEQPSTKRQRQHVCDSITRRSQYISLLLVSCTRSHGQRPMPVGPRPGHECLCTLHTHTS